MCVKNVCEFIKMGLSIMKHYCAKPLACLQAIHVDIRPFRLRCANLDSIMVDYQQRFVACDFLPIRHTHTCAWSCSILRHCMQSHFCGYSSAVLTSDESVELQELSLVLHTSLLEKKPSLSLLSIENWSRSEKGRGDQQMSPELFNKMFSMKSTQCIHVR